MKNKYPENKNRKNLYLFTTITVIILLIIYFISMAPLAFLLIKMDMWHPKSFITKTFHIIYYPIYFLNDFIPGMYRFYHWWYEVFGLDNLSESGLLYI